MNEDILEGKWKQIRGKAKIWWGELTDDDLDKVAGMSDRLLGLLQEKYGYTREKAEEEVNRRLRDWEAMEAKTQAEMKLDRSSENEPATPSHVHFRRISSSGGRHVSHQR